MAKDLRSRFKKKSKETKEKIFKERDKQLSGGSGKTVFNQDILDQLGLTRFKPNFKKEGSYYGEILPPSFDDIPYFAEMSVHEMCGINNDHIVCMKSIAGQECYRCSKQKQLYNLNYSNREQLKAMYARDKVIYLWWDRTDEIGKDEDPKYDIKIWDAIKQGVHQPLQSKTRDKKTKENLDISDVSEGGEGRTVYFEIGIKSTIDKDSGEKRTFPQYDGWELMKRDDPIPDEILEKLTKIIEFLEETMEEMNAEKDRKYKLKHPLEVLIDWPEEGHMEEVMSTEVYDIEETKGNGKKQLNDKKAAREEEGEEIDLEDLEEKLTNMNRFKLIKYIKDNDLEGIVDLKGNKEEIIEVVLTHFSEMQE